LGKKGYVVVVVVKNLEFILICVAILSSLLPMHDFFITEMFKEEVAGAAKGKGPHRVMLTRLLALAAHALAEVTSTNAKLHVHCIFKIGHILHINPH